MQRNFFPTVEEGINNCIVDLKFHGREIKTDHWQGIKSPAPMIELLNLHWQAPVPDTIEELQKQCQGDYPWAEDHFQERISRIPSNPGHEYKNWPGYKNTVFNDNNFRPEEKFTHTYQERYWPKIAGVYVNGNPTGRDYVGKDNDEDRNFGIRFHYGDLDDVIKLLRSDPFTRQAYLPIWFPEDTGVIHGGRVPCSIGYHFIFRDGRINIQYLLRACDAKKHFKNDVYLTCRLLQYVARELGLGMGNITMDIISFHVFKPEFNLI